MIFCLVERNYNYCGRKSVLALFPRILFLVFWCGNCLNRIMVVQGGGGEEEEDSPETSLSVTNLTLDPVLNGFQVAQGITGFEGNGYANLGHLTFTVNKDVASSSSSLIATYLDVVVVPVPDNCFSSLQLSPDHPVVVVPPSPTTTGSRTSSSNDGVEPGPNATACDWTQHMGIGYSTGQGNDAAVIWYCCSVQAVHAGVCSNKQLGRLLLNPESFAGTLSNVTIPPKPTNFTLDRKSVV